MVCIFLRQALSCAAFTAIGVLPTSALAFDFSQSSVTFPASALEQSSVKVIRFTNKWAQTLQLTVAIQQTSCPGGHGVPSGLCSRAWEEETKSFDVSTCGTIGPGESCDVQVTFSPRAARRLNARLRISGGIFSATADLTGVGTPLPLEPDVQLTVEYRREASDTYFYTYLPNEILALDAGLIAGWARTGFSFYVHPKVAGTGSAPVCRFYGNPEFGLQSHFFSVLPEECSALLAGSGAWIFESSAFFAAVAPDDTGTCPDESRALLRLFNDRVPAAHRFMTVLGPDYVRAITNGWVPEGYGLQGSVMCVARQVLSTVE